MRKKVISLILAVTLLIGASLTANAIQKSISLNGGGTATLNRETRSSFITISVSNNNSKTISSTVYHVGGNTTQPISKSTNGTGTSLTLNNNITSGTITYFTYTIFNGLQPTSGTY